MTQPAGRIEDRLARAVKAGGSWRALGVIFAFYTFLGLIFVPEMYILNSRSPQPIPWSYAILRNFVPFYTWAAVTPLIFWFGKRWPLERRRWLSRFLIHFLISVPVAATMTTAYVCFINAVLHGGPFDRFPPLMFLVSAITNNAMLYWAVLAVSQALNYFRKYQEREYRLAQAQLQALKSQLHPHFLFNTLNAISELVYVDAEAADRAISHLSDLLRGTLSRQGEHEIALRDELELLGKYVEIQKLLFQDRLTVEMHIEGEALNASVPNLILQPLVENAIRHGIDPHSKLGRIEISAERADGMLHLAVRDNGPGLADPERAQGRGIGLSNTRARLEHMYGDRHRFELNGRPGDGLTVDLSIPFREVSVRPDYETSYSHS